jgi:hypothetical protein
MIPRIWLRHGGNWRDMPLCPTMTLAIPVRADPE